jgi:hypothetical protein
MKINCLCILHCVLSAQMLFSPDMKVAADVCIAYGLERKRKRSVNEHRPQGYCIAKCNALNDRLFRRMFRMDRAAFEMLLGLIKSFYKKKRFRHAKNSSGSLMSHEIALAGGSYLDLLWGCSSSTYLPSS